VSWIVRGVLQAVRAIAAVAMTLRRGIGIGVIFMVFSLVRGGV